MHNPIGPKFGEESLVKIGKAVRSVADKVNVDENTIGLAQTEIVNNLERPGPAGTPQIMHVSFVEEVAPFDKIVVVPDLGMIKAGEGEEFEYSDVYINHSAKQLLKEFDHDDNTEPDLREFLQAKAYAVMDDEEFLAYRLGE